jgi:hypothetical protein
MLKVSTRHFLGNIKYHIQVKGKAIPLQALTGG